MFSDLLPKADFAQPFAGAQMTGQLSSGCDAGRCPLSPHKRRRSGHFL